jgi:predicted nucleic acid-binding protein
VIKLALVEESSERAREQWAQWRKDDAEVVAPPLLLYEITSTLRNKVHRALVLHDEADEALGELLNLPIALISPPDIHERAWELATRFNQPTAYDANYLAVAEALDCPFWTADRRLYNAVKQEFPAIQLVGSIIS